MEKRGDLLKKEREKIDRIDKKIIYLLDKRVNILKKIAKIKKKNNLPIFQPSREKEKLKEVFNLSKNKKFNTKIFKFIIKNSRELQKEFK